MDKTNNMDSMLRETGGFGRYQIRLSVILFISVAFCGMHMAAMMFEGMSPTYECDMPYKENVSRECNLTWSSIHQEKASVYDEDTKAVYACQRYEIEATPLLNDCEFWRANISSNGSSYSGVNKTKCEKLVVKSTYMQKTIVTDFDLACGGEWQTYLSQSLFMAGVLLNGVVFGYFSDKAGRKPAFFSSILLCGVVGTIVAFGNSFVVFCILRSIVGMSFVFLVSFVIGLEAVETQYRAHMAQMLQCGFALGIMLLAPIAAVAQDWRKIQLIISVPMLALLLCWWFVYESPRWLLSVGRTETAMTILKKLSIANKVDGSTDSEDITFNDATEKKQLKCEGKENESSVRPATRSTGKVVDLFRKPRIRCMTINLFFNWFSACCVYYGLVMSAVNIGSNPFISTILGSVVEIVATMLVIPTVNFLGRRNTTSSAFFTSGAACIIMVFLPKIEWLLLMFYLIGKLGITFVFGCIFIYTSELYPTVIRSIGTGGCSGFARVGGIAAPFVAMLVRVNAVLPYFIFGILSLLSAFLMLLLPETLNQALCDTVEQGESFLKQNLSPFRLLFAGGSKKTKNAHAI